MLGRALLSPSRAGSDVAEPTPPLSRAMRARPVAALGAALGLFEGLAVARWDILMGDFSPGNVAHALGVAAGYVALDAGSFFLLGWLAAGWAAPVALGWFVASAAARWAVADRAETEVLWVGPLVLVLSLLVGRLGWLRGLLAVALAAPALWGRVPNYTLTVAERLEWLAPLAALTVVVGAVHGRWRWVYGALGVAGGLGVAGAAVVPREEKGQGPNVVYILVDTLRRDTTSGYTDTPMAQTVAGLAAGGVTFDDAVTVIPKTTQSVAAQQTGKYPTRNGVRVLKDRLSSKNRTLAEVLRGKGYATAAFVHNGWIMRGRGFEQGFQQFWSWFELERPYGPFRYGGLLTALDAATARRITPFDGNPHAETSTSIALDWMAEQDGPFYAYIHYFDPHWPYAPPGVESDCMVNNIGETGITRGAMMFKNTLPEAENERARALYREEVGYTERQVQRVLDWLRDAGLEDDTLVVFTADHGHHLGDHGYYYHHGEFLYEPGVLIPLVMRWPGKIDAGTHVSSQVRSIDIMPTVLGLLGIKHKGMDGVNALTEAPPLAILETDISYFKENTRRYVKGVTGKVRGVRTRDWKLVYSPRKGEGKWELYDLRVDRAEANDLVAAGAAPSEVMLPLMAALADSLPRKERAALEKLGNHFDRMPTGAAAPDAGPEATDSDPMSETDRAMLRSLGYVE